jgi:heme-degrading monooxygenase HmoA
MIVVSEQFFVVPECRAAFDAWCERLLGLMAMRPGCCHVVLSHPAKGAPSHVLYSAWESVEQFREWTRSDAFVLAASGTLPDKACAFVAPKRMVIELIDSGPGSVQAAGAEVATRVEGWPARGAASAQDLARKKRCSLPGEGWI